MARRRFWVSQLGGADRISRTVRPGSAAGATSGGGRAALSPGGQLGGGLTGGFAGPPAPRRRGSQLGAGLVDVRRPRGRGALGSAWARMRDAAARSLGTTDPLGGLDVPGAPSTTASTTAPTVPGVPSPGSTTTTPSADSIMDPALYAGAPDLAGATRGVNSAYAPALRLITRDQQRAQQDQQARLRDMRAFEDWVARGRVSSQERLQADQAATNAAIEGQMQATRDRISQYVDAARSMPAEVNAATGRSAANAIEAALAPVDASAAAYNQILQRADSTRLEQQATADDASARTARAIAEGQHGERLNALMGQLNQLSFQRARDVLAARQAATEQWQNSVNSARTYQLEREGANYLRQQGANELALNQYRAETDRLKVTTDAQLQDTLNRIRLAELNGTIQSGNADRRARLAISQSNIDDREKQRVLDRWRAAVSATATVDAARIRAGASGQPDAFDPNEAADALAEFTASRVPEGMTFGAYAERDMHNSGQLIHTAIANLASRFPNMTQAQVINALRGEYGDRLINLQTGRIDPNFYTQITRMFRPR